MADLVLALLSCSLLLTYETSHPFYLIQALYVCPGFPYLDEMTKMGYSQIIHRRKERLALCLFPRRPSMKLFFHSLANSFPFHATSFPLHDQELQVGISFIPSRKAPLEVCFKPGDLGSRFLVPLRFSTSQSATIRGIWISFPLISIYRECYSFHQSNHTLSSHSFCSTHTRKKASSSLRQDPVVETD